jgi:Txe/YoeB family toxin of Txe-Axe toxin-antitoxin module
MHQDQEFEEVNALKRKLESELWQTLQHCEDLQKELTEKKSKIVDNERRIIGYD